MTRYTLYTCARRSVGSNCRLAVQKVGSCVELVVTIPGTRVAHLSDAPASPAAAGGVLDDEEYPSLSSSSSPSRRQSTDASQAPSDLPALAKLLRGTFDIRTRRYHMKSYHGCFVGSEAVTAIVARGLAHD